MQTVVAPLGRLASLFTGVIPSRLSAGPEAREFRVVNAKDVAGGLPPIQDLDRLSADGGENLLDRFGLRIGDVVLTARGIAVRAAVVSLAHVDALAGANLIVARPGPLIEPRLLAAWLRHPEVQSKLLQARTGVGTPGFTVGQLGELKITVPPMELQQDLAQICDLAARHHEAIVRAAALRSAFAADLVFDAFNTARGEGA